MNRLLTFLVLLLFASAASAQTTVPQDKTATKGSQTSSEKAVMQDGNSAAPASPDKAVMQDGNSATEKKAVMQDGNSATEKKDQKEHKCNEKCRTTKHNLLHGEKGHTCAEECKKADKK